MADSSKNSYRSILKGTSIFGGVQVFLMLISLVRGKFVAMFLGPEGMGLSQLFTASTNTVITVSSLGLNLAIVKEVAAEKELGDNLGQLLRVVNRLVRYTAIAGCAICALASPLLSEWSFGDTSYAWQFVALSAMVFLMIVSNGKLSVLQGLHEVKRLSKATVVGALAGLLGGVPLYYFFGTRGIVPALILFSAVNMVFYHINLRRATKDVAIDTAQSVEFKPVAKRLISLGLLFVAGTLFGNLVTYLINIYLRHNGDVDTVGLYQAANSITSQYATAVFAAMSLDYFPRLAAVANDNNRMIGIVNRQSEIVALVLGPISIAVILTAPLIISVLLTDEFYPILDLMRWLGLGVLLKGLQFPIGYITFAKNNKRLFFILEVVLANTVTLVLAIVGYHFFGLVGLGYAIVGENIIGLIVGVIVNNCVYGYRFSNNVKKEYSISVCLTAIALAISLTTTSWIGYAVVGAMLLFSVGYSFKTIKKLLRANESVDKN